MGCVKKAWRHTDSFNLKILQKLRRDYNMDQFYIIIWGCLSLVIIFLGSIYGVLMATKGRC